jgi:Tol biopolymer transport system component
VLYFTSARPGGPARMAVYRAQPDEPGATPQALPSPVNDGSHNSDFTLSPDGRFALWWSHREGTAGPGDLYLAERRGEGFGPARRLPEPVNGPGLEFTPSVSADGQWLYFASTGDQPEGLSHVFRTSWPALLQALQPM